MKNYMINRLIVLIAVTGGLYSCTPEQDVAPIDTDNPVATIEPQADYSSASEGDTLKYTITVESFLSGSLAFGVDFQEASTASDADIEVIGGSLAAYTKSTEIAIVVLADDFPENEEVLDFLINTSGDIGNSYRISPHSDVEVVQVTVQNVNDPTLLSVAMEWVDPAHESDFDLLIEGEVNGSWGAAATAGNPEISTAIWNADPDDTFYVGVDPYAVVDGDINFSLHIGYPDGTVEIFDGVFNVANIESYTADQFTAWGIPMYRLATIVKSGSSYDVTFEF